MSRGAHRAVMAAGIAVALALLLAMAGLAWAEHRATHERVREHTELMARVFTDHAGRSIDSAALAAGTVDELVARGVDPQRPEMQAALAQLPTGLPFLRGAALLDDTGRVLASADGREQGRMVDLRALAPLPDHGMPVLGRYVAARRLVDLAPGATAPAPPGVGFVPLIVASRTPDGRTVFLVAPLNADAFANFQQVTMGDVRMSAALLALDGQLVAATAEVPGDVQAQALAPFTRFLPARESGSWAGPGLRPEAQIASFRLTRRWPLVAVVEFDAAAADTMWWRAVRGQLGIGVLLLVLTLALTLVAARSVRARLAAQVQVALRERELSTTLEHLEELVFRCDRQGRLRFVNGAWLRLAGGDAEGWRGRSLAEVVAPAHQEALARLLDRERSPEGGAARVELLAADGVRRSFDLSLRPLEGEDGFAGSAIDVSAQVMARQRLQEQLAFSELLLESSPLPMSVVGRDRRYRIVNRAWEQFNGRRRADVVGHPVGEHLPAAVQREHEARDEEAYATGEALRYEARVPHADGTLRDVIVEKRALPGLDGLPDGILNVIVDVTEFRVAERATREARDAAEEASRAKTEFIANISHELRTPLQSIIGFSELGQRRAGAEARLRAMFDDIHRSGHRMLALVNDLLDVSRIESSVGTLTLERGDLRTPVRDVLAELQPLAAKRAVLLDDGLPAHPMPAKFDPLRLQQVLRNVIANAIRFSPEHGTLEIAGGPTGDGEWRITVADRGPGIPEAELDRIFEAFVQSSRTKDGSGGTGLGLAISRTLMRAHGGSIGARNREGGGSVFEIVLPARAGGETQPMPL